LTPAAASGIFGVAGEPQLGWRDGEDWDAGYAYFDAAWDHVLQRLEDSFDAPAP
jgi:hypothetical protein